MDLNELAVQAKTSNLAFNQLVDEITPGLNKFVNKYYRNWKSIVERDEIEQWVYIELWSAVRSYDPNGMPFEASWKWVVSNHMKTRMRRLAYGRSGQFDRATIRFDFQDLDDDPGAKSQNYVRMNVAGTQSAECTFLRREQQKWLHRELRDIFSVMTDLEHQCTRLFYFENYSYADIQAALGLHSKKTVDNALVRIKKKIGRNKALQELYLEHVTQ